MIKGQIVSGEIQASAPTMLTVHDARQGIRPPFLMGVCGKRITWENSIRDWVPELIAIPLIPGVNGVGINPRTKAPDPSHAIIYHQKQGYDVFKNGDARLKEHNIILKGEYMSAWPIAGVLRKAFGWFFEGWSREGDRVIWTEDTSERIAFMGRLLESGLIAPIQDSYKRAALKNVHRKIDRLETQSSSMNKIPPRLAREIYNSKLICLHMEARLEEKDPFIYPEIGTYKSNLPDPFEVDWEQEYAASRLSDSPVKSASKRAQSSKSKEPVIKGGSTEFIESSLTGYDEDEPAPKLEDSNV